MLSSWYILMADIFDVSGRLLAYFPHESSREVTNAVVNENTTTTTTTIMEEGGSQRVDGAASSGQVLC